MGHICPIGTERVKLKHLHNLIKNSRNFKSYLHFKDKRFDDLWRGHLSRLGQQKEERLCFHINLKRTKDAFFLACNFSGNSPRVIQQLHNHSQM